MLAVLFSFRVFVPSCENMFYFLKLHPLLLLRPSLYRGVGYSLLDIGYSALVFVRRMPDSCPPEADWTAATLRRFGYAVKLPYPGIGEICGPYQIQSGAGVPHSKDCCAIIKDIKNIRIFALKTMTFKNRISRVI